jgi:hypothetical protein
VRPVWHKASYHVATQETPTSESPYCPVRPPGSMGPVPLIALRVGAGLEDVCNNRE